MSEEAKNCWILKNKVMTQEEINNKFTKENHCEKYLVRDVSEFNPGVSYQVQTTTGFCVDEKSNPTEVTGDFVCVTIYYHFCVYLFIKIYILLQRYKIFS